MRITIINNPILRGILLTLFGLAFVVGATLLTDTIRKSGIVNVTPAPIIQPYVGVTCPADLPSYQNLNKNSSHVVKLIGQRKRMFAQNGQFVNTQVVVTKNYTQQSKVACGYLYIKAGTLDKGALQSWEYIYINPDLYGGHIYTADNIISSQDTKFSEYLLPLNRIQYWKYNTDIPAGKRTLSTADWTAVLNISDRVTFNIAFNTNDNNGYIDEVSIAYRCWNPITGQENDGCRLSVVSSNDTTINSPF